MRLIQKLICILIILWAIPTFAGYRDNTRTYDIEVPPNSFLQLGENSMGASSTQSGCHYGHCYMTVVYSNGLYKIHSLKIISAEHPNNSCKITLDETTPVIFMLARNVPRFVVDQTECNGDYQLLFDSLRLVSQYKYTFKVTRGKSSK